MPTTIDPTITLAELVIARPALTAPLERLGLDYCCGGRRALVDAVDDAGLDLAEVVATLDAADAPATPADWATMGPAELVDHLEATHHVYLHDALPRLDTLATKVAGVHGSRHPELVEVQALVRQLHTELDPHLAKEEQVLFPMIRQLDGATTAPSFHCGTLANPIRVMLAEHDTAGALLARLRTTTDDYRVPDDGCASYRALYDGLAELEADTHLHVHKENNVLFPAVLAAEAALSGSTP
ncbi:MAG: iron-sulfur cluster repair di-iron protein [Acidimicrobiia bacterium]|nr:iron-sulfur cluster repair di-iron protein [Acidimicrobiia bacterium]